MQHSPVCVWTSFAILIVAIIRLSRERTVLNTTLVLLGIVSVFNHSRLSTNDNEWCVNDALRWMDIFCVLLVCLLLVCTYGMMSGFLLLAAYALVMYIFLQRGIIRSDLMAPCWGSVHILFVLMLVSIR